MEQEPNNMTKFIAYVKRYWIEALFIVLGIILLLVMYHDNVHAEALRTLSIRG